ncbi:integrase arm-type DNA-binding domain-containing protein [Acaryochloris sp. 'Moss Beach']|uniref:tyrosine-type recombinase/integrase n=1 Tax=Acaryochloris sp. 'Moss Beach' TaxID=2740837 RepID=UPI001F245927|nr:Arm DNA-binding domain-containing protein [Acaryochloris sp. 'Moss Beach']UJB70330.1 integrase arm-type DNA-binding domain-containing protein [Acaryochloris sp. 'Moss Beach']
MATPKLTDIKIRKAKPTEKNYKIWDGDRGLFLLVKKNGSKIWHHKFWFGGKEKLLSLGKYPEVGLKDAREKHREERKLLASGINPSTHRKAKKEVIRVKNENSFELVAREWFNKQKSNWKERSCLK